MCPAITHGNLQRIELKKEGAAPELSLVWAGISALQASLEELPDLESHEHIGILGLCRLIWPIMMALFLSGLVLCLVGYPPVSVLPNT